MPAALIRGAVSPAEGATGTVTVACPAWNLFAAGGVHTCPAGKDGLLAAKAGRLVPETDGVFGSGVPGVQILCC
ncbi:hypothetical protein C7C46_27340 [Streptomyces tateyamensis]|uniref:Uncharacterized protein n=1 Tax=Streptomyces tateyamensis TaxID=565073 RepID=A0A2V4NJW2_9ACTN|nr:hypothetical protein C7C46_27340 [Streptomyces tateyamensis]